MIFFTVKISNTIFTKKHKVRVHLINRQHCVHRLQQFVLFVEIPLGLNENKITYISYLNKNTDFINSLSCDTVLDSLTVVSLHKYIRIYFHKDVKLTYICCNIPIVSLNKGNNQ